MSAQVAEGIDIAGFVDTSYSNNLTDESNSFSLEQVEVDITSSPERKGGFRVDFNYVNGQRQTTDNVLEQGYIWISIPCKMRFVFGKFNAPIGFESLDTVDMYQFSHAMVFDYGLPTNLTGAMISGARGKFDFALYIANGWDQISDDNKAKTFGGRVGISPADGVNLGLSYISGEEGSDQANAETSDLSALDMDITITRFDKFTLGFEYNSGTYAGQSFVSPGDDSNWSGWLVMARYAWTEALGVTVRYDEFEDEGGTRFGSFVKEKRTSFTISPSYQVMDGLLARAEYRFTASDEKVFPDSGGDAQDSLSVLAVELVYSF